MGWGLWQLLPEGLQIWMIAIESDGVTISVGTTSGDVPCPVCNRLSNRVHRYCNRILADLPWLGRTVKLRVRARHLYCRNPSCPRKVFSERLTGIAGVYTRRTDRLAEMLLGTGYELGGEAGARQARDTGMSVSGSTLLRLIRRAPLPDVGHPVALGVDDWCWRKRQSYGTILVDLERHRPVDLLPDRASESFARWLKEHPGVKVISRDRGNVYAEGASEGAPNAIQVADRWHLLKNLSEAIERFLARNHSRLKATAESLRTSVVEFQPPRVESPPILTRERKLTKVERDQQERRTRRKARYDEVVALSRQGQSQREIARAMGLARPTVRRFLRAGAFPERAAGARRYHPSIVDPHEPYLRSRWDAGCQNAAQLYRELRERGFTGSEPSVRYYVRRWRVGLAKSGKPARNAKTKPAPPTVRVLTPRQVTWLLLRDGSELGTKNRAYLDQMCRICPEVVTVRALALEFVRMVRERDAAALEPWLESAEHSGIQELVGLAQGLRQDIAAVTAALSTEWSAGQTEGNINRLKLLKRQMYGRAGFDLLRQRVLHTSRNQRDPNKGRCTFGPPPPIAETTWGGTSGVRPPTTSGRHHPMCG